jgi:peptidoglycan/LPS O-acetylase OafA/YrhL
MKFRFIFPAIYTFLLLMFLIVFLIGAGGHGSNPFDLIIYVMMPLCLLLDLLPASWGPKSELLSFALCAFAGLLQWGLIGYVMDRLIARRRKLTAPNK